MEDKEKTIDTEFERRDLYEGKRTPLQGMKETLNDYINLRIDEYKLRGVEGLAILSNKTIFLLIATMIGGVILQLLGLALAFMLGDLVGNIALGFLIVALFFIILLIVLFIYRKQLFIDKLVRLYISLFFKD